jgi:hypothetical protein
MESAAQSASAAVQEVARSTARVAGAAAARALETVERLGEAAKGRASQEVERARAVADAARRAALRAVDPLKAFAEAEAARAVEALRERFGGLDESRSAARRRAAQLARYRLLYDALAVDARGGEAPINDVEEAFGAAGLLVARTEVGRLAYEADADGGGALDFGEFTRVLDALSAAQCADGRGGGAAAADGGGGGGSFFYGTEGASLSLRAVVWHTLRDPGFSRAARLVGGALTCIVAAAALSFVAATEPAAARAVPARALAAVEAACAGALALEYALKLACAQPSLAAHAASAEHWVDLLTLAPFFLTLRGAAGAAAGAEGVLRVASVARLLRLLQRVPYVGLMRKSAASAAAPLAMALFVMAMGTVLLAFAAYYAERGHWSDARRLYVVPGKDGVSGASERVVGRAKRAPEASVASVSEVVTGNEWATGN